MSKIISIYSFQIRSPFYELLEDQPEIARIKRGR